MSPSRGVPCSLVSPLIARDSRGAGRAAVMLAVLIFVAVSCRTVAVTPGAVATFGPDGSSAPGSAAAAWDTVTPEPAVVPPPTAAATAAPSEPRSPAPLGSPTARPVASAPATPGSAAAAWDTVTPVPAVVPAPTAAATATPSACLLYTSDAADDLVSV